eukprot:jgi/Psemu1/188867/e_gw1.82.48.1
MSSSQRPEENRCWYQTFLKKQQERCGTPYKWRPPESGEDSKHTIDNKPYSWNSTRCRWILVDTPPHGIPPQTPSSLIGQKKPPSLGNSTAPVPPADDTQTIMSLFTEVTQNCKASNLSTLGMSQFIQLMNRLKKS